MTVYTQLIIATLVEAKGNELTLRNNEGIEFIAEKKYVDTTMSNSDTFTETKKVTATEMQNIILGTAFTACSITFQKKNVDKTAKALREENTKLEVHLRGLTKDNIIKYVLFNTILPYIPGEIRTIKGYHKAVQDSTGRLEFYDMEDKEIKKTVDLRTVTQVIVKNVKYIL
jgi:hypothetical protein